MEGQTEQCQEVTTVRYINETTLNLSKAGMVSHHLFAISIKKHSVKMYIINSNTVMQY